MLGLGTSVNRGGFVSGAAAAKLLDTYSSAAAAYSLRQLSDSYSGNAVKVRRASDDTELDIGFSSGELDTSALATHCGSSNGFVVTWYDQSGNSNNATQSTAANQPKIYDATAERHITENGKPAIEFDGGNDGLNISPAILASSQKYTFTVHAVDSGDTVWSIFCEAVSTDVVPLAQSGSGGGIVFGYTLNSLHKDGGSAFSGTRNDLYSAYTSAGQALTTIDFSGDGIGVLFQRNSFLMTGTAQEIVIYGSDQSSNRTAIEAEINTFYSIF